MEPWEGLDINDSQLDTFVRRCNTTTNLILGPAGNLQAVLLNRNSSQPKSTQDFVRCITEASHHQDLNTIPWEWAQKFINFHGKIFINHTPLSCLSLCLKGLLSVHNVDNVSTLSTMRTLGTKESPSRLVLVSCVVKSCESNGLGDMTIIVKVSTYPKWYIFSSSQ